MTGRSFARLHVVFTVDSRQHLIVIARNRHLHILKRKRDRFTVPLFQFGLPLYLPAVISGACYAFAVGGIPFGKLRLIETVDVSGTEQDTGKPGYDEFDGCYGMLKAELFVV